MSILKSGDKIGIVACSNGLDNNRKTQVDNLVRILKQLNLIPVFSNYIYKKVSEFNGTGEERGRSLMDFFKDKEIKAIFDISGGDLANGVLEYLDFNKIKDNPKPFFGYSDLSVIINSIYAKTEIPTYLYQIRNLVGINSEVQIKGFKETFMEDKNSLLDFRYRWIQGNSMEGTVVGGNIRCFLKLAGTEYIPDFQNKILFLESLGGDVPKMDTFLTQYKNLGVFKKIKGIILGTYIEMEREKCKPSIIELVKNIVNDPNMPIIKTDNIGHGQDSKCIIIGKNINLKNT